MADLVNDRVNAAQALLQQRANRLRQLVEKSKNKKTSAEFQNGVEILANMIKGQSEIIDGMVFREPNTGLEQMRNLQLTTGGMNQTPAQFLEPLTTAMDAMLDQLESMVR